MPKVARLRIDDEYEIIQSAATVVEAAKVIRDVGIPDLVVLDGESILGIVTDFEITTKVVAEGKDPHDVLVKEIMYSIEPIDLKTSVEETFEILNSHNIPLVPVAQHGKLLGVVTIGDCWAFLSER